ncbi:MAG: hypothetical protein AAF629_11435 [Chloroflexota bacterium]
MSQTPSLAALKEVLAHYDHKLDILANDPNQIPKEDALSLLRTRDTIQSKMQAESQAPETHVETLICLDQHLEQLDDRLKLLGPKIASKLNLPKWRNRIEPDEAAWWWFFEPPIDHWDRFDWIWNAMTLVCLALAASFMINLYTAISIGNLTVAGTFSTLLQITGLAVVGSGALTTDGQRKVQEILGRLNIAPRFFAEATFAVSLVLMVSVYITNFYLDEYFFNSAAIKYQAGSLSAAEVDFLKAIEIEPSQTEYSRGLGQVYESLGSLDKATEQYFKSVEGGSSISLNNLGRAFINKPNPITGAQDPALAEAYLLLGLQRMQTRTNDFEDDETMNIIYQLNRNIGWALLKQEKYQEAELYFRTAIDFDTKINNTASRKGQGMAHCFLAQTYQMLEKPAEALAQWQQCRDRAMPEYVHEYKWFLEVGQDDLAYCVDTSHIVSGYIDERVSPNGIPISDWCNSLFTANVAQTTE